MGFPREIAEQALLASGRHCCLCHKFCGIKIETHHIKQKCDGGDDSLENCIPLCFDCHAEVKAYDPKHPKGRPYSESELKGHRDRWYEKVKNSGGLAVPSEYIELDRKLLLEIKDQILPSNGSIAFIRSSDFGASFLFEELKDLKRFYYKNRDKMPEFEFFDIDLENLKLKLAYCINEFLDVLCENIFLNTDGSHSLSKELNYYNHNNYMEILNQIHKLADNVCQAYDDLIRLGRRKLAV